MEFLGWVDNRTLLASECIVIVIFAAMMFGLRALNPGLRGITSVAGGVLCGVPAAFLFTSVGHIPIIAAGVVGGGFTFASSILLYRGVLQFCCGQHERGEKAAGRKAIITASARTPNWGMPVLYAVCVIAFAALVYFTHGRTAIAPCVAIITLTLAISRWLMAWTLYRCAGGRTLMILFSISMAVFGIVSASNASITLFANGGNQFMQRGSPQTISLLFSMIFFCVQGVFYLLMFAGDVTENVHEQARLDHLSGTLNRRGIEDALAGEMERRRRTGGSFAVLLIDIDHFKAINDRDGHAAGDESLKKVAKCINATVRAYDQLGRFGGDEFLLLLPQTREDEAMWIAERTLDEVRGMASETPLTVSIGVTCCSAVEEVAEVLSRADAALYEAKRAGRDCVRLHDIAEMQSRIANIQELAGVPLPGGAAAV